MAATIGLEHYLLLLGTIYSTYASLIRICLDSHGGPLISSSTTSALWQTIIWYPFMSCIGHAGLRDKRMGKDAESPWLIVVESQETMKFMNVRIFHFISTDASSQ